MKKLLLLAVLGLVIAGVLPLMAQQKIAPENESDLYYVNIPIEKVYNYKLGYVVVYRSGVNKLAEAYIPFEWFRFDQMKAQLIQLGDGKTRPCMSVFYKEGAFHSVRLYVAKRTADLTWGSLPSYTDLDGRFEGVESLDIKF